MDFSLANLVLGLQTALSLSNLSFCLLGVVLGMVLGVLPGIGALAAISMLIPITYHLDPTAAIIMVGGIYYGTSYGGSISSILLRVPGTPSSAIACLDGYPMAKQGRGGIALLMSAIGSFVGASVGIIIMMAFSPAIAGLAITFQSPEYFALMVLGLVAASSISQGSPIKAIAMVVAGILFGLVGLDIYSGASRFTFGSTQLLDGIGIVAIAMGLFGIPEVVASVRTTVAGLKRVTLRSMLPTREDTRRSVMPIVRGSALGSLVGALPGIGGTIASFLSYAIEKRVSKHPEQFGGGAIEGVAGPETANNAADQTSFIPTMALGIPGSASMAVILGILIIHGITPGPRLIIDRPDVFWGLVMSFWIGNLMLLVLNIPLIGIWVRLLQIPYHLLYPAILVFLCVGVYSVSFSVFDVWMVIMFGALGYAMRYFDLPTAPMLLGFILGPMLEDYFRRSMIVARGDLSVFVTRPISATALVLSAALLLWSLHSSLSRRRPDSLPDEPKPVA